MKERYNIIKASRYGSVKTAILKELAGLSREKGYAYCSVATLASFCGMKERSMQSHLRQLEQDGVIRIEYGVGRKHVNHYHVDFTALAAKTQKGASSGDKGCSFMQEKGADSGEKECSFVPEKVQLPAPDIREVREEKTDKSVLPVGGKNGMSNTAKVLNIWESWNKEIEAFTKNKGTPIPAAVSNGVISGTNLLYDAVDSWIRSNTDWETRWQLVLGEIPINAYFRGFTAKNGRFWHPTLRDMFVPRSGWKGQGTPKDIGVERVLSGEFEWMRDKVKVDVSPQVTDMSKYHDKTDGVESY